MARTTKETVVLGGVVYPAGTSESDIDGDVSAEVWEDSESGDSEDKPKRATKRAESQSKDS